LSAYPLSFQVKGDPNVVNILGACNHTIVTEGFSHDLDQAVQNRTEAPPIRSIVATSLDAARGLQALHESSDAPIVHFDIKPSQVGHFAPAV